MRGTLHECATTPALPGVAVVKQHPLRAAVIEDGKRSIKSLDSFGKNTTASRTVIATGLDAPAE